MYSYEYNNKALNLTKLVGELATAGFIISSIDSISPTQYSINFETILSDGQKQSLDSLIAAHTVAPDTLTYLTQRILDCRTFGIHLVAKYGATNIMAGYNVAIIQDIMTRTARVQAALNSGSLYVAITELNAVTLDSSIVTTAKIKSVRNEIEDYLGITRT